MESAKASEMISVIVPVYNVAPYLRACVESILNQTYPKLEVLLIDDGSTDGSSQICDDLSAQDVRVCVIHQENHGVSVARNVGLDVARGDYISFVDADDLVDRTMIEALMDALTLNHCELAVCGVDIIDENHPLLPKAADSSLHIISGEAAMKAMFYEQAVANGPVAKLYKKSFLNAIKFPVGVAIGEDLFANYHYLLKANKVVVDHTHRYYYRQRAGSALLRAYSSQRMQSLHVMKKIASDVAKRRPTLMRAAASRQFMEALYIIWAMPRRQSKQFRAEREECIKTIKQMARQVFVDTDSPLRNRAYASVALLNASLLVSLLNLERRIRRIHSEHDKMQKVLIRHYSANNLGDDLFVKVLAERYKNTFSAISHCRTVSLNKLPNLQMHRNRLLSSLTYYLDKTSWGRNLWLRILSRKNDLMVYIGGSIFMEGKNFGEWQSEQRFYDRLKLPYYILGANFGPYKTPEFRTVIGHVLRGAVDVCFRDEISRDAFPEKANVRLASDIVFALDVSKYRAETEKSAVISVINGYGRFSSDLAERYDKNIYSLAQQLLSRGYKVTLMSFCKSEGDEAAIGRIIERGGKEFAEAVKVFSYCGNIDAALSLLASCEVIIATRFHATILGLLLSKKVLPILYSDKTMEVLKDMNFDGPIMDIRNGSDFVNFDPATLTVHDVQEQIADAQAHFKILDNILERSVCE